MGKSNSYTPTMTIIQFFEIYSPVSDGNNPTAYGVFVAKRMGVGADFQIKELVWAKLSPVSAVVKWLELSTTMTIQIALKRKNESCTANAAITNESTKIKYKHGLVDPSFLNEEWYLELSRNYRPYSRHRNRLFLFRINDWSCVAPKWHPRFGILCDPPYNHLELVDSPQEHGYHHCSGESKIVFCFCVLIFFH